MAEINLRFYKLSNEADFDLNAIFDYTKEVYSFNQAVKYISDLETVFNQLVKNPYLGRERKEIRKNIYSISEQKHTVS